MARPKKGQELHASESVALRIGKHLRLALERLAEKNGRSITDEMRMALEAHTIVAAEESARNVINTELN